MRLTIDKVVKKFNYYNFITHITYSLLATSDNT